MKKVGRKVSTMISNIIIGFKQRLSRSSRVSARSATSLDRAAPPRSAVVNSKASGLKHAKGGPEEPSNPVEKENWN